MHVTPEDEKIGLVLNGLHPETSLVSLKKYLKSFVSVRDCWIYRQGVVCIRLEDEKNRNLLRNRIESLKTYPLPIYDPVQRNWLGKASDTQPLLFVEPLNANFDPPTPDHGKILLMRSVLYMPLAISAIFRPYKTRTEEVRMVRQRLTTHGKTIYEYLLGFPTIALAQKALSNHAGEEISIPYRYLLTEDKVRFPHGKTMHIWLRQTGLSNMPTQGFQEMTVDEVPPRAIEAEENALPYAKEEADEKV
ncbi:hypothetical protein FRB91_011393 [Serendipita sp. 411]|nr:hypothetical protein FRB91_011393 [Serendipita sp. 411]